jgi:hypothetical protein
MSDEDAGICETTREVAIWRQVESRFPKVRHKTNAGVGANAKQEAE